MAKWQEVEPKNVRASLLNLIGRLPQARVGVIGDVAADLYVSGQTDRVSREAPVIIVKYEKQWLRPGCAANVACNVAALGATVHMLSLVGQDEPGTGLLEWLSQAKVDTNGMLAMCDYQTATKTRFMAGAQSTMRQQVLRVDRMNSGYPSRGAQSLLLERLKRLDDQVDVWVASDYGAGLIDDAVRDTLRQISRHKVVLADSRYNLRDYHGMSLVKPNQEEALATVGDVPSGHGLDGMAQVSQRLRTMLGARAALVTLGNQGMMLAADSGNEPGVWHIPAAGGDEIVDLTGAGDTSAAVLAAGLSAGGDFVQSACLANAAGGVVVMRHGAATASLDDISKAVQQW